MPGRVWRQHAGLLIVLEQRTKVGGSDCNNIGRLRARDQIKAGAAVCCTREDELSVEFIGRVATQRKD